MKGVRDRASMALNRPYYWGFAGGRMDYPCYGQPGWGVSGARKSDEHHSNSGPWLLPEVSYIGTRRFIMPWASEANRVAAGPPGRAFVRDAIPSDCTCAPRPHSSWA